MTLPPGFYGIADADASDDVLGFARALLAAGVPTIQLRMKHRPASAIRAALRTLLADSAKVDAVIILNDHPDIAAEFPGVGVHLGQGDADPMAARALLPDRLIGWSTHTLSQVTQAGSLPVDYIGFGPVFSAATKHLNAQDYRLEAVARGVPALRAAVEASAVPVVAIGGIDRGSRAAVLAAGPHAVVAIGAISRSSDPGREAADWVDACRP